MVIEWRRDRTCGSGARWDGRPVPRDPHRRTLRRSRTMAETALSQSRQRPSKSGVFMSSRNRLLVLAISTPIIAFAFVGRLSRPGDRAGRHLPAPPRVRGRRLAGPQQLRRASGCPRRDGWRDAGAGRRPRPGERLSDAGTGPKPRVQRPGRSCRSRARPHAAVLPARRVRPRRFAGGQGRYPHRRLHPRHRQPAHARHVGVRREPPAARRAGHRRCRSWSSAATQPIRTWSTWCASRSPARTHVADGELHDRLRPGRCSSRADSATRIKQAIDALAKTGASRYVIDLRGTVARRSGRGRRGGAAVRQGRNAARSGSAAQDQREPIAAQPTMASSPRRSRCSSTRHRGRRRSVRRGARRQRPRRSDRRPTRSDAPRASGW